MELLRGYAYFRSEAEFAAVGKARAGIAIDRRRVHSRHKFVCRLVIFGDDALAVTRSVFIDMLYGLVDIIYYLYRHYVVEVLATPVVLGGFLYIGEYLFRCLVAAQLDIFFVKSLFDELQRLFGNVLVN